MTYTLQGYIVDETMIGSKSLTAILAVALMLSNMACAYVSTSVAGDSSGPGQKEHHHSALDGTTGGMPCAHHDCAGCEDLQGTCTTPDTIPVSAERDSRATAPAQFDGIAPVVPPDTPVHRKDQLIE